MKGNSPFGINVDGTYTGKTVRYNSRIKSLQILYRIDLLRTIFR
jgi:hypothetical protein